MSLLDSDRKSLRSNNDAMSSASSSQQSLEEERRHAKKYILLQDKTAKSKRGTNSTAKPKFPARNDEIKVLKGSLWEEREPGSPGSDSPRFSSPQSNKINIVSLELDEVFLSVNPDLVRSISYEECSLLLAVPTHEERYLIFEEPSWLEEGLLIKEKSAVLVKKRNVVEVAGTVRWRGRMHGRPGTWFGVELEAQALGDNDGSYNGKRLFQCEPNYGLFVTIANLRLQRSSFVPTTSNGLPNSNHGNYAVQNDVRPQLSVGERIVWISDHGPEHGTVRWLGDLEEATTPEKQMAGVEFDNPVGTGTGKYRGVQLFVCKQNHASLVPVIGLIRGDEYNIDYMIGEEEVSRYVDGRRHDTTTLGHPLNAISESSVQPVLPPPSPYGLPHAGRTDFGRSITAESLPGASSSGKLPPSEKDPYSTGAPLSGSPSMQRRVATKQPQAVKPPPGISLEVGSLVEVLGEPPKYGTIRWIGTMPDTKHPDRLIAGLEMEEAISGGTAGKFMHFQLFHTAPERGFFLPLDKCRKDSRFSGVPRHDQSQYFGSIESVDVDGHVSPPCSPKAIKRFFGKKHGIQGHHNSCYLDACLFCMFSFSTVFDHLLHRSKTDLDLAEYTDIQSVLRMSIVNPLRKNHFVRADKVLKLRTLLDHLGLMQGLMGEEKDPEEFLSLLLQKVMRADPFIKFNNGQECHTFQLTAEKDDKIAFPRVQQLLERTCVQESIKFSETPSCLILQMPRFGKHFKMYDRILPNATIDITDLLVDAPRECYTCGNLATHECFDCYKEARESLSMSAFCSEDNTRQHQKKARANHKFKTLVLPNEYLQQSYSTMPPQTLPREKLDLFAVLCIETSHYVAFVKCGAESDAPWVFFDSMADREGDESGYNIPEVMPLNDMNAWLSDPSAVPNKASAAGETTNDKQLPPHLRRLLCDGYICFYQSKDAQMYK